MKLLRTTLAALLMSCCATISAYDFCADGIYYNILSDTEVEVTYGDEKYSGDITIPENVTYDYVTYSVTTISSWAFFDCTGLTNITIGDNVTTIESPAFDGCTELTSIVVAEGNTKYDSREECNAIIETASNTLIVGCKNSVIPNSVTTIGESAFARCSGLTNITIGNSVTTIGSYAFCYCTGLTNIEIPNSVTTIGDYAFCDCTGLTSIEIPNSVTTIGDYAFYNCTGLTSIEIPNSVTTIGNNPFQECEELTSIVVAEGNTKYDSREECNAIIETVSNTLIVGCKNSVIPNSVTTIGNEAFSYCPGLTSIEIPNSVTTIGDDAFSGCNGLTSIEIPNSVTTIGDYAFYYCTGLTSIEIPNSVTTIGDYAFYYCTGLTSIEIPNSVTSIENTSFQRCEGLTNIVVAEGNTKYDSREECNAIIETESNTLIVGCKNTTIPNSVTTIGNYAFKYCTGLTSIKIPNSVTTIGERAFQNCYGLTIITSLIPAEKLFVPGNLAFDSCNSYCILYVPAGAYETYAATEGWNEFRYILELEDTNIDKVVSPNNSLYFDLNGRGVENPTRGIYIVNGKKILVK